MDDIVSAMKLFVKKPSRQTSFVSPAFKTQPTQDRPGNISQIKLHLLSLKFELRD